MGIYDKTIELLETLSPFSYGVFLALHFYTQGNKQKYGNGVRRGNKFPPFSMAVFLFLFCYFLRVLGCFRWKEKEKHKSEERCGGGREKKKGSHRGLTLQTGRETPLKENQMRLEKTTEKVEKKDGGQQVNCQRSTIKIKTNTARDVNKNIFFIQFNPLLCFTIVPFLKK